MEDTVPFEPEHYPAGRARQALLRRLIDYTALPASRVAPQDRSMAGDILLDMLLHATENDRKLCATRLATMREAPRRVLRYLAQCPFEVARPIIEENEAFDSSDLIELIEIVGPEHRAAIAARKRVAPVVCDHLARAGELHAVSVMLANPRAELSETTIDRLVARSRKENKLCELMIERQELRPAQAMAMFWWSDAATRRAILLRFAADRTDMIDMCSDIFAMAAREGWQDPVARKTLQLIERRQRNRAAIDKSPFDSLEQAIKAASVQGLTPDLAQEIGYLAGVKPVTIAKMMSDKGGEGLAVLCKATGLKRPAIRELWQALRRPLELDEGTPNPLFEWVAETYEILSVAKAQTTLRYWNWSLSAAFSPNQTFESGVDEEEANDENAFSTSRRTARLVFGK